MAHQHVSCSSKNERTDIPSYQIGMDTSQLSSLRDIVNESADDRWATSSSQIGKGVEIMNEQLIAEQRYAENATRIKQDATYAMSNDFTSTLTSRPCDMPLPNDIETENGHNLLKRRLREFGLVEHDVKTDGNCQFRALSYQLYESEDKYGHVRKIVCDQMQEHHKLYKDYICDEDWTRFMNRMRRDCEWGDHVTLQAFVDATGRSIHLVTSYESNEFIQINPQPTFTSKVGYDPILLGFWAEVHYNPIVNS